MIHAKDIMIGDWVGIYTFPNENPQPKDLFPARISTIMTPIMGENGGEYIECQFNTEGSGIGCASRPVETCFPIPLTPKILEKNGFSQDPLNGHIFIFYEKPSEVIYYEYGLKYGLTIDNQLSTIQDLKIKYVHELQHALRLCGIEKEIEL